MKIPRSYDLITVRQFLGCVDILNKKLPSDEENTALAAYLLGRDEDFILNLPYDTALKIIDDVKALKESKPSCEVKERIIINGKIYKSLTDISKFSFGRFLHLDTHKEIHQRAAVLFVPNDEINADGNYEDGPYKRDWPLLADAILDAKMNDVYGVVFFYLNVWKSLKPVIEVCMLQSQRTINLHMREILDQDQSGQISQAIMDGTGI